MTTPAIPVTSPLEEVLQRRSRHSNPCLGHPKEGALFLECVTRDGRVYGFPYSHLTNYLLEPNPAIEDASDAPPQRLSLWFPTHLVVILGWYLSQASDLIRSGAGLTLKPLDSRYANLKPEECFICEVAVLAAEG